MKAALLLLLPGGCFCLALTISTAAASLPTISETIPCCSRSALDASLPQYSPKKCIFWAPPGPHCMVACSSPSDSCPATSPGRGSPGNVHPRQEAPPARCPSRCSPRTLGFTACRWKREQTLGCGASPRVQNEENISLLPFQMV